MERLISREAWAKWARWGQALEWALVLLLIAFFIQRWFYRFYITPDSTFYLVAAVNFVKSGSLYVYTNWPSWTWQPGNEIFSDYAPGYVYYLSFFVLLFREPLLAGAIGQAVSLVALFLLVHRVAKVLGLHPIFRVLAVGFVGLFRPHVDCLQSMLNEALFVSFCLVVLLCCVEIFRKGESRRLWIITCVALFCAGGTRWNGFACIGFFLPWFLQQPRQRFAKIVGLGVVGTLPIGLWFLRNYFLLDRPSAFYIRPRFMVEKLWTPFEASIRYWGMGHWWLALAVLLASLAIFALPRLKKQVDLSSYCILLSGWICQFLVIYGLSLVTFGMTPVDDRYLVPTTTIFILALLYSLNAIFVSFRLEKLTLVVGAIFIAVLTPTVLRHVEAKRFDWLGVWNRPIEEKLWQEIKTRPYYAKASHFYSDENYTHQVFSELSHRLMRGFIVETQGDLVRDVWNIPTNPFFVMSEDSKMARLFEDRITKEVPQLKSERILNFIIYYRD